MMPKPVWPNSGVFQGTLTAIRNWFRDYKIPDGKPANKFGLGNKPANKVTLLDIFLFLCFLGVLSSNCFLLFFIFVIFYFVIII